MPPRIVIMGVSGCGKSTVGSLLASQLNVPFLDGDDFHPDANRQKMSEGIPLTDADRHPWLETLAQQLQQHSNGCVLACSALKRSYRDTLRSAGPLHFILLEGSHQLLLDRLTERSATTDHFMPSSLLQSQLTTLEDIGSEPDAFALSIQSPPHSIVQQALSHLAHHA
ncbi:gluconokinase [Rubritalea tangerina]|uniref:Gluconokinase n=2 Tax=Rubritalea tangerina TaxID=430798 RepID=A0ABW4ZCW2_9BACT